MKRKNDEDDDFQVISQSDFKALDLKSGEFEKVCYSIKQVFYELQQLKVANLFVHHIFL